MRTQPKVSIGLPVHNGERYISEAIESILDQDFDDFELIISDNASTDTTADLCREYVVRDDRVAFHRHEQNRGAAWNFNFVFERAQGEYFKWAAHDDLCARQFISRCVDVLDRDPSVILCYSNALIVDPDGELIEAHDVGVATDVASPRQRFRNLMLSRGHKCFEIFGVIRRNVLEETPLMGNYAVGDRVLLARLALRGPFFEIPDRLFISRAHETQSVHQNQTQHMATAWFDQDKSGKVVFPEWRTLREYARSLRSVALPWSEKFLSRLDLLEYTRCYRKRMRGDLIVALRSLLNRHRRV